MKTWQSMMKHEAGCPSHPDFKCRNCGNSLTVDRTQTTGTGTALRTITAKEPCACVTEDYSYKCTCHRDEYVAAIEGVVRAANTVLLTEEAWTLNNLNAALDRLNALADASGKEGE